MIIYLYYIHCNVVADRQAKNVLLTVYTPCQPARDIHLDILYRLLFINDKVELKILDELLIIVFLFFQPGRLVCDTHNIMEHECSDVVEWERVGSISNIRMDRL